MSRAVLQIDSTPEHSLTPYCRKRGSSEDQANGISKNNVAKFTSAFSRNALCATNIKSLSMTHRFMEKLQTMNVVFR